MIPDRPRAAPSLFRLMRQKAMFWIGIVFLPVGLGLFIGMQALASVERRFERDGITVTGTVTERFTTIHRDSDGHRSTRYHIGYVFTPEYGPERTNRDRVSLSTYGDLREGQPVEIQYLETDPSRNRVASEGGSVGIWLLGILGSVFGGSGAVLLALARRNARRLRAILMYGIEIAARTVSVMRTGTRVNGVRYRKLVYEYLDPDDRRQRGESLARPPNTFSGLGPDVPVRIFVDPTDPSRSAWAGDAEL
ncbi:MAG: DUF3592 domain-containing protein [Paracoccaceae bacterium]